MTLQTSGAITLAQIQTEFGGSNPIGLNEYYSGGSNVPSGTYNSSDVVIPTSGTISFSNFYGATKFVATNRNYTSAASGATETIPAGAQLVVIEAIGASGGGGGGFVGGKGGSALYSGGGGGSGGLVRTSESVKANGRTFTYTVGSAGSGGAYTASGVAGGASTVSNGNGYLTAGSLSAGGGGGGVGGLFGAGGGGGSASGGTVVNTAGNAGAQGGSVGTGSSAGGAGLSGSYNTGSAGGNGGYGGNAGAAGGDGKIYFAYT
jgi:hypothetical protein